MRHLSKFLPYPESSPSLPDASADQEHRTGLHTLVTESFRPLPQGSTGKKDGHLSEGGALRVSRASTTRLPFPFLKKAAPYSQAACRPAGLQTGSDIAVANQDLTGSGSTH